MKRLINQGFNYNVDDVAVEHHRVFNEGDEVTLISCALDDRYDSGVEATIEYNGVQYFIDASFLTVELE